MDVHIPHVSHPSDIPQHAGLSTFTLTIMNNLLSFSSRPWAQDGTLRLMTATSANSETGDGNTG